MDVVTRIQVNEDELDNEEVLGNDKVIKKELEIEENIINGVLENEEVVKEELGNEVTKKELENEEEIRKEGLENEKIRNVEQENEEIIIKKEVELENVRKEELENRKEVRKEKLENEEMRNVEFENEEIIIKKEVEYEEGKKGDLEHEQEKRKGELENEVVIIKEEGISEEDMTKEELKNEEVQSECGVIMDVVTRIRVKEDEVDNEEVLGNDKVIKKELEIEANIINGVLENEVVKEELGNEVTKKELGNEEEIRKEELENEKIRNLEQENEEIIIKKEVELENLRKEELENRKEVRKEKLENEEMRNVEFENEEIIIKKEVEYEEGKKGDLEHEQEKRKGELENEVVIIKEEGISEEDMTKEELQNEEVQSECGVIMDVVTRIQVKEDELDHEEVLGNDKVIKKELEIEENIINGVLENEEVVKEELGIEVTKKELGNEEEIRKEELENEKIRNLEQENEEIIIKKEVELENVRKEELENRKEIRKEVLENEKMRNVEFENEEIIIKKEVEHEEGKKGDLEHEQEKRKGELENEVGIIKEEGISEEDMTKEELQNEEVQSECNVGVMNFKHKEEMIEYEEEGSESKCNSITSSFSSDRIKVENSEALLVDIETTRMSLIRMVDKKNKKRRLDIINDEQSEKPCKQVKLDQEPKSPANSNPIEPSSTEVNQNVTDTFPTLAEILPVVSNNVPDKAVKTKRRITEEEGEDINEEEESVIAWFEAMYVYPSSPKEDDIMEVVIESTGIENEEDKILRTSTTVANENIDELVNVMSQETKEEETILPSNESIGVDKPTSYDSPVPTNSSFIPSTYTSSIRPMTNTSSSYSAIPTCSTTSLNPSSSFTSGISEHPTVNSNQRRRKTRNRLRDVLRVHLDRLITAAGFNGNSHLIKHIFNIRRKIRESFRANLIPIESSTAQRQKMKFTNIRSQIPTENTHWMNSPNHVSREQNNCLLRDSPSYNGFPRRGYEVFRSDFNGFPPNNSTVLPLNQHNGIVSDHLNEYPLNQQNGAVFNTFSDFPLNNNPNGIGPGRLNGFVLNDPNRIVSNSNFPSRDLDRFSERDQNELSPRQNEMYLPRFIVPDYQSTREDCVNCLSILHSPRPNELSAEDLATTSTQHECPHTRFTEYSVNFQPEDFELGYRLLTESTEPIEYQSDFMPQRISLPDIRPYEYDFQDRPSNHSQSEYLLNDPRIHRMRQLERTNASQFRIRNPEPQPEIQIPSPEIPSTVTESTAESTEETFESMPETNNSSRRRDISRELYFQKRRLSRILLSLQRKAEKKKLREMQLKDPSVQLQNRVQISKKKREYLSKLVQALTMPSSNIPLNFLNNYKNEETTEEEED